MFDDDKGLYTIGTVAELIAEHPETLRVWERNDLIRPDRTGYQRKYSSNDVRRLKFIKYLMDNKGLNIAGVKHLTSLYSCWYKRNCNGGAHRNTPVSVNESKACWKIEGTYCFVASDKAELCNSCDMLRNCNFHLQEDQGNSKEGSTVNEACNNCSVSGTCTTESEASEPKISPTKETK